MTNEPHKNKTLKLFIAVGILIILTQVLFSTFPKSHIEEVVQSAGYLGPVLIITFIALSEILAPIPGSPAVLTSLTLFGWEKTVIYSYVGLLIAVSVNFFISRLFGRKFIVQAFGNTTLEKIDTFTKKEGKTALVISRTIGYPFSDFVSYASGLTNIKFSTYFVISAAFLGISHLLFMLLFRHLNFDVIQDFIYWFILAGLFGGVFGLFLKGYYIKSQ